MPIIRYDSPWSSLGVVTITEPGTYQVLIGNGGPGLGIRRVDDSEALPEDDLTAWPVDSRGVAHPCSVCTCCKQCGCDTSRRGLCGFCSDHARWVAEVEPRLEQCLAGLENPADRFCVNEASGLVHTADCPAVKRISNQIQHLLEQGCTHNSYGEDRCLVPVDAQEAAAKGKKRCRTCSPNITLRPVGSGRFVKGGGRDLSTG